MKTGKILGFTLIGLSRPRPIASPLSYLSWSADRLGASSLKSVVFMLVGLVSLSTVIIFSAMQIADSSANRLAMNRIDANMRVAWHFLHELGPEVSVVNGKLHVGSTVINDNSILVDELHNTVGGVATVFQDDTRIATTVRNVDGTLGVGTHLAKGEARTVTFEGHSTFRGVVDVLGRQYFSGYDPIFNKHGIQIGMLYVGISRSELLGAVTRARLITVAASSGCIFLIALFFIIIGRHLFARVTQYEQDLQDIGHRLATAVENSGSLGHDGGHADPPASSDTAQRLLAGMVSRISVPVLLVQSDGSIIISNLAYQRMIGYSARELSGRSVDDFTPPEDLIVARSVWRTDAANCVHEANIDTITRSGVRLPLRVVSDAVTAIQDQKLRVVTIFPRRSLRNSPSGSTGLSRTLPEQVGTQRRSIGQLQAISLAAIKAALGEEWPQMAARAMSLAEEVIKYHVGERDVFRPNNEDGFVIWFDDPNEDRNNAVLDAAVRDLRLKFLAGFGNEVSNNVSAILVSSAEAHHPSDNARLPDTLLEQFRSKRGHQEALLSDLKSEIADLQVGSIDAVIGRDGRMKPLVVVDLPVKIRHRMSMLSTASVQETDPHVDVDLLRLKLAVRQINNSHDGKGVLATVSWQALISPDRRWSIDECLGSVEPRLRSSLNLAISGVPPLPSDRRWRKIVEPLQRQFRNVGLVITLTRDDPAFVYETMASVWPFNPLVIDATDRLSAGSEKYFTLITAARKRDIDVLVRVLDKASMSDWQELGATMFTSEDALHNSGHQGA